MAGGGGTAWDARCVDAAVALRPEESHGKIAEASIGAQRRQAADAWLRNAPACRILS
jgi:hypothetical protein